MLPKRRSSIAAKHLKPASVFAALGDETRLTLIAKLAAGRPRSISQLTKGSQLSRQAISKHLRVLQTAGMVQNMKTGRENRFEFDPRPIACAKGYLDFVSEQWDQALLRLKSFVEM